MIGGLTLGWDFDHYFGCEMRLAFGRVVVGDTMRPSRPNRRRTTRPGLGPPIPRGGGSTLAATTTWSYGK